MILDSNMRVAVTCEKCGKINVEQLNLFKINHNKTMSLYCTCGSLNLVMYFNEDKNININAKCIYCGEKHDYSYNFKDIIKGTDLICPEIELAIARIGDRRGISSYIKESDKKSLETLCDKDFELFFNNHQIMKKSLEKLMWLRENGKINCECGDENIAMEIYSDRIELRCIKCQSTKIIYAENQEDLDEFYEKKRIEIDHSNFKFINLANNSDHK